MSPNESILYIYNENKAILKIQWTLLLVDTIGEMIFVRGVRSLKKCLILKNFSKVSCKATGKRGSTYEMFMV